MSERDRAMAIATLAEAFNVRELTPAQVRIYERALQKVPAPVLEPMVNRAVQTRTFFPKVAELLQDADYVRLELVKANAYTGCCECEQSVGWRPRLDDPKTVERCPCFQRHQQKLAALGVGSEVLALPSSVGDGE